MPADVRKLVKEIREQRLTRHAVPAPSAELADQPGRYMEAVQDAVRQIARGFSLPKQIPAKAEPTAEYTQVRGTDRDPLRIASLSVACPWPACKVLPGTVCVDADGRRLSVPAHEARLKAAGLAQIGDGS